MTEHNTVKGMTNTSVAGPPTDPPSYTWVVSPEDAFNHGKVVHGDPDATSERYFIETDSPELADIVTRIDDEEG